MSRASERSERVEGLMTENAQFHMYNLRCADDSYYVGSTHDLDQRVATHNAGRGSSYTATRLPVILVYSESFDTIERAHRREMQIKRWSRVKKEALISGDLSRLSQLSKR